MASSGTGPPRTAPPPSTFRDRDGDEHRSGWWSLVRPADGRRDQVLGQERLWPARGPDHHRHQQHHPRQCVGDLHSNEYCSGRRTLVRPADRWRDQVLGLQRLRSGRRWDHHPAHHPCQRDRDLDGDEHRSGRRTLVRPAFGRRDQVLGLELPRPARGWDHHRTHHPRRSVRHLDGDEHRSGRRTLVRPADGRRDQVLGQQQQRQARGRNHHRQHHPVDVIGLYAPPPSPPSVFSATTSFSLIISLYAAFALNALFA